MPLASFGSILTFAEEMEIQDMTFYSQAINNPECSELKLMFEQFIKECKKNIVIIQRTRRENVTEMILEPIQDFFRAPFCIDVIDGSAIDSADAVESTIIMEQRSVDYYTNAAVKIKALPEVSNALRKLNKKHSARLKKVSDS
jgi:rubrerythrin